jgi:hypothetical protein
MDMHARKPPLTICRLEDHFKFDLLLRGGEAPD